MHSLMGGLVPSWDPVRQQWAQLSAPVLARLVASVRPSRGESRAEALGGGDSQAGAGADRSGESQAGADRSGESRAEARLAEEKAEQEQERIAAEKHALRLS